MLRVADEIDRRQSPRQLIDVADPDELVVEEIAPLLGRERVQDEAPGELRQVAGIVG